MEIYLREYNETVLVGRRITNIKKIKFENIYNFAKEICKPKRKEHDFLLNEEERSVFFNLIYSPIDKPFLAGKIEKCLTKIQKKINTTFEFYFKRRTGKFNIYTAMFKLLDINMKPVLGERIFKFSTADMFTHYQKKHNGLNPLELCPLKKMKKYFVMNNQINLNNDFKADWVHIYLWDRIPNLKFLYRSEETGNYFYEYQFDSNQPLKLVPD